MKDKAKGKGRASGTATPTSIQDGIAETVVTTQQSRFHVDLEPPVFSDDSIAVKDLTLSLGERELLAHADLKLKAGRRYVLVGRNGSGKSTLLKALAEGRVPGVSWRVRIVLLGQAGEGDVASAAVESGTAVVGETVLGHVVRSDRQRERALREAESLSNALNDEENTLAAVWALRKLENERLRLQLREKQEIAKRRSGPRGLKARQDLIACEKEVEVSNGRLNQRDDEISPEIIESETQHAAELLAEVQQSLEAMDSQSATSRATTLLRGLGFPDPSVPYTSLSGGWRTRCTLASCLFTPTHVLLLDEPTNFLDLPALVWLENYLCSPYFASTQTTCVVVTHDRAFADAMAEELLVLREQKLEVFKGGPTGYDRERRRQIKRMSRMKELQEKKDKNIGSQIAGNVKAAKKTGDDKKLKQAASRKKKLEERSGIEVGKSGGRFKLNRDLAGYHLSKRSEIEVPKGEAAARMNFGSVPETLKFPGVLVSAENVTFGYRKGKEPVLKEITLVIYPGERVGIVGLNGSGKSTLVKLLAGDEDTGESSATRGTNTPHLKPTKGTVTRHSRARIGWFSQHAVDELHAKGLRDRGKTALVELMEAADGGLGDGEARAVLAGLGLQGRTAGEVPLFALSGGQKVRVALAKLVWSIPHMLVLDEVTTHLDAESILALIEALNAYEGALLVVTHDRFFMRTVVEGEDMMEDEDEGDSSGDDRSSDKGAKAGRMPGVVYRAVSGQLKRLEGGMKRYEEIVMGNLAKVGKLVGG